MLGEEKKERRKTDALTGQKGREVMDVGRGNRNFFEGQRVNLRRLGDNGGRAQYREKVVIESCSRCPGLDN